MVRTTPPKPVDMESQFPELAAFRRTSIRLHPRPGHPSPQDSSVGGPLLWPADVPWPVCPADEHHVWAESLPQATREPVPLVSVVQIHRRDVPELTFPDGADVLQVLWCPFIIDGCPSPTPQVYWRDGQAVGQPLHDTPPQVAIAPTDRIPDACVVHPEPVAEYPSGDLPWEVREALRPRFQQLDAETGWKYDYHLADAPGIKLGGYPSWKQEPYWPVCEPCGTTMEHLLTVDSWEYDGQSWRTWLPIEDRGGTTGRESSVPREGHAVREAAGIMIGDAGGLYVFQCMTCPDRPVGFHGDCS